MVDDTARDLTLAVNNLTRVVTNLDELLRRDYPKRTEIDRRFVSKQVARRMIAQGVILVLLMCVFAGYVIVRLDRTQACLQGKIEQLSGIYGTRSGLIEQETAQNKKLWLIYAEAAGAIKDPAHPHLSPPTQQRLNEELIKQLLTYKSTITHIEQKRAENPPPVFREGSC